MALHRLVWDGILQRHGFQMTDQWWDDYCNVAMEPFVLAAIPDADDALIEQLTQDGIDEFVATLHRLQPLDHVVEIARANHGRLPMAVVTGGFRDAVVPSLDAVGIIHLFDVIVCADDVVDSKPAPDVYLKAMEVLQVLPESCVVYEDSEVGIASARSAGIDHIVDVRVAIRA